MRKTTLFIIMLFLSVSLLSAGIREDADRCFRTAQVLVGKSNNYAAGDEKNACMQKAVKLLDHALELYDRYIENNPGEAKALEDRITEINGMRFWCNRLTTTTFNKSSLPTVEKILEQEGVSLSGEDEGEEDKAPPKPKLEEIMAKSKRPLTKEEAEKIAIETMKRDFLKKIQGLIRKRLIANARIQCKRMLRYKELGIEPAFFNQILKEIDYAEMFLASVFDSAMQMKGKKLTLAKTIHNMRVEGVVTKFDKGMLHVSMEGKGIEMGIPLFNFDDGFLIRNVSSRSKEIMAGIGAFFILEGRMDYAKNTFTKIAGMEGEPKDLSPFLNHISQITAVESSVQKKEDNKEAEQYILKNLDTVAKRMKRKDYDGALKYMHKILDKAGSDMDLLLFASNAAFKETVKYLPELVQELVEGCPVCNKSREMTCKSCAGKGRYKVRGKWKWCPTCKGETKAECLYCKKRLASKKNKEAVEKIRKLFKRDESEGGKGGATEEQKKKVKEVKDRIPL